MQYNVCVKKKVGSASKRLPTFYFIYSVIKTKSVHIDKRLLPV